MAEKSSKSTSPSPSSLPLDFSLQTSTERSTHVSSLLQNLDASSLSSAQLNLLQEFILWGKDSDGKTGHQKHEFELKSRGHRALVSLEQLQEQETSDSMELRLAEISPLSTSPRPSKFSREKARRATRDNPQMRRQFEELWERIDTEEFMCRVWRENYRQRTHAEDVGEEAEADVDAPRASRGGEEVISSSSETSGARSQDLADFEGFDGFDVFGINEVAKAEEEEKARVNSPDSPDSPNFSTSSLPSNSSSPSRLTSAPAHNFIQTLDRTLRDSKKSSTSLIDFCNVLSARKQNSSQNPKPPDENSPPQFIFSNFDGIKMPATSYFEELRGRIPKEKQPVLIEKALNWTQRLYTQHRNHLIEMREEQYTLQDFVMPIVATNHAEKTVLPYTAPPLMFGDDIPVLPLGLINSGELSNSIFQPREKLNPETISTLTWRKISDFLSRQNAFKSKAAAGRKLPFFDFENEEHVYQLFKHWNELGAAAELREETPSLLRLESTLKQFLDTISFYSTFQDLSDSQREILRMKLEGFSNYQVMKSINQSFGKSYSENYISTIFKKRVIKRVCAAAAFHKTIVERLADDEAWKKCSGCGMLLLLDEHNFNKNARTTSGFQYRCRFCQRAARQEKENKNVH